MRYPPWKGSDSLGKRALRLHTPTEIRAALTKIANECRTNQLTPQQTNALVCVCNAILGSLRTDELERRLAELEKLAKGGDPL